MKERILQQLYGIWVSDPASEPYLNRIREDLQRKNLSEDDIRLAAGTALQYMLHLITVGSGWKPSTLFSNP